MILPIRYTLVTDGPSDVSLQPIINWAIKRALPAGIEISLVDQFADFRRLRLPPKDLAGRLSCGYSMFPCDLMIVHRDAEKQSIQERQREIAQAYTNTEVVSAIPYIPVIPIRMTEAWLLIDESAIRRAAGNPNGGAKLTLPPLNRLERTPNPKQALEQSLLAASELQGRRREQFKRKIGQRKARIARLIEDYSPLRQLSAYRTFEERVETAVQKLLEGTPPHNSLTS